MSVSLTPILDIFDKNSKNYFLNYSFFQAEMEYHKTN